MEIQIANPSNYPDTVVDTMADIFEQNLIDGVYISDEVRNDLADEFGKVPLELRAIVFQGFLDELTRRGLKYDIAQFVGNA